MIEQSQLEQITEAIRQGFASASSDIQSAGEEVKGARTQIQSANSLALNTSSNAMRMMSSAQGGGDVAGLFDRRLRGRNTSLVKELSTIAGINSPYDMRQEEASYYAKRRISERFRRVEEFFNPASSLTNYFTGRYSRDKYNAYIDSSFDGNIRAPHSNNKIRGVGFSREEKESLSRYAAIAHHGTGIKDEEAQKIFAMANESGYFKQYSETNLDSFKQKTKGLFTFVTEAMRVLNSTAEEASKMIGDLARMNVSAGKQTIKQINMAAAYSGLSAYQVHQYASGLSGQYRGAGDQGDVYMKVLELIQRLGNNKDPEKALSSIDRSFSAWGDLTSSIAGFLLDKNKDGTFEVDQEKFKEFSEKNKGKPEFNGLLEKAGIVKNKDGTFEVNQEKFKDFSKKNKGKPEFNELFEKAGIVKKNEGILEVNQHNLQRFLDGKVSVEEMTNALSKKYGQDPEAMKILENSDIVKSMIMRGKYSGSIAGIGLVGAAYKNALENGKTGPLDISPLDEETLALRTGLSGSEQKKTLESAKDAASEKPVDDVISPEHYDLYDKSGKLKYNNYDMYRTDKHKASVDYMKFEDSLDKDNENSLNEYGKNLSLPWLTTHRDNKKANMLYDLYKLDESNDGTKWKGKNKDRYDKGRVNSGDAEDLKQYRAYLKETKEYDKLYGKEFRESVEANLQVFGSNFSDNLRELKFRGGKGNDNKARASYWANIGQYTNASELLYNEMYDREGLKTSKSDEDLKQNFYKQLDKTDEGLKLKENDKKAIFDAAKESVQKAFKEMKANNNHQQAFDYTNIAKQQAEVMKKQQSQMTDTLSALNKLITIMERSLA